MKNNTLTLASSQAYFDNWRELSPMDNAILRVIETHGGEIRQAEIASILGVADVASISRRIKHLVLLGLVTVTKYGRTNSYVTIFFVSKVDQKLTAAVNVSQTVNKQTTTDINIPKNKKISKRQITETDYDNAKAFGIQVEAPITCTKGKPTLDAKLRGKAGQRVSDNLQAWRDALDAGTLDLTHKGQPMTVNLIACRIVECQAPILLPEPEQPAESPSDPRAHITDLSQPDPETVTFADDWQIEKGIISQPLGGCQDNDPWLETLTELKSKLGVTDTIWNQHFCDLRGFQRDDGSYAIQASGNSAAWLNGVFLDRLQNALDAKVEIEAERGNDE